MSSGTGSVVSSRLRLAVIASICGWTFLAASNPLAWRARHCRRWQGGRRFSARSARLGPVFDVLQELVVSIEDAH